MPLFVPLPGGGRQWFQPIHMDDFVRAVVRLLEPDAPTRILLSPVGRAPMTLRDILLGFRRWLGFSSAVILPIPMAPVRLLARAGDAMHWFGSRGSFRTDALRQMEDDNVADAALFIDAVGFTPRHFAAGLASEPAQTQDRWHARLYFLRPLLRVTIGLFWMVTGLIGAVGPGREHALILLRDYVGARQAVALLVIGTIADFTLGLLLLLRYRPRSNATVMIAISAAYLGMATWLSSGLWLDPLGPLLKVLPIIVATLIPIAIEDDR